jgi:hypothetical protein
MHTVALAGWLAGCQVIGDIGVPLDTTFAHIRTYGLARGP